MDTTTLSSKGQIIIPKPLRDARRWRTGMEFVIESVRDGILLRPRKPFPPTRLEDGVGCAGYSGPPKTLSDMEQGVLEDIRQKWRKEHCGK